jgi:hypothetical protein
MFDIAATIEIGFNDDNYFMERRIWRSVISGYGCRTFYQVHDLSEIIAKFRGELPLVFITPRGDCELRDFEHPKDCIYLFGAAHDNMDRFIQERDLSVRIDTPKNQTDMFAAGCAGMILRHRDEHRSQN